jgi:uncharacterized membrane protein YraQ (UPF0718 family)/regulator of protease activity HflC (stomatin/prohibitin superfamily)
MIDFALDFARAVIWIVVESGPYLVVGLTVAGLLQALLPQQRVATHLGKDDLRSVILATLFGAPLPLCSCSVIPTAVELRKKGASKGATTAFLISTPETGVDSIGVTWALLDPIMTITRPLAAMVTAITAGSIVNLLVRWKLVDRGDPAHDVAEIAPHAGHEVACCDEDPGATARIAELADDEDHGHGHGHGHAHPEVAPSPPRGPLAVLREAIRYGFGPLLADLTPWFVIGFLLSGLIAVLVPDDFFGEVIPGGIVAMLLMLAIASPMYICATASTPVAAALIAKGLEPGAALVLLLAGPAVNVATMLVVGKLLGRRVFVAYFLSIATLAIGFGLLIEQVYAASGIDLRRLVTMGDADGYGFFSIAGGLILGAAIVYHAVTLGLGSRFERWIHGLGLVPRPRFVRYVISLLVLLGIAGTALDSVPPGTTGFVTRFGRVVSAIEGPGFAVHLPFPIDRFELVATDQVRRARMALDEDGREEAGAVVLPSDAALVADSLECMTSDETVLVIGYAVHYRVSDAHRYRFELVDADQVVRVASMGALRRMVARHSMDEHLVERREPLEREVTLFLEEDLAALDVGIEALAVRFEYIHAPQQVHYAYRDVASALEDKQTDVLNATAYEREQMAQARADAERIVQQAEQERTRAVARARGEVAAFLALAAVRAEHRDAVDTQLRLAAAQRAFPRATLIARLAEDVVIQFVDRPRDGGSATGTAAQGAASEDG